METIAGLNENESQIFASLAEFGKQNGTAFCSKDDVKWELDFADQGLVGIRCTPDNFDWTRVLSAIPDLTTGEQKQLRQLMRVGGRSPFAAAEELGISLEELRELLEKQRSRELITDLFHGGIPELITESAPVDYPIHGPIFLDDVLVVALTSLYIPKEIARFCVPLGSPVFDLSFLSGWPEPLDPEASPLHFYLSDLEALDGETSLKTFLESRRHSARELLPVLLMAAVMGAIKPGTKHSQLMPFGESTLYEFLEVSTTDSLRVVTIQYGRKLKKIAKLSQSEEEKALLKDYLVRGFQLFQDPELKALYDTAIADGLKGSDALNTALATGLERQFQAGLKEARAGRFADAFRQFLHCAEFDPFRADFQAALGLMHVSGHPGVAFAPEEAITCFQLASDGRGSKADYLYYFGVLQQWMGEKVEAARAFEAVLALNEHHDAAREQLEELNLA